MSTPLIICDPPPPAEGERPSSSSSSSSSASSSAQSLPVPIPTNTPGDPSALSSSASPGEVPGMLSRVDSTPMISPISSPPLPPSSSLGIPITATAVASSVLSTASNTTTPHHDGHTRQQTHESGTSTSTSTSAAPLPRTPSALRPSPLLTSTKAVPIQPRASVTGTHTHNTMDEEVWKNLQNLKNLLTAGFITPTEYNDRKSQLIDEMTGTTCTATQEQTASSLATSTRSTSTRSRRKKQMYANLPAVVSRPPPNFDDIDPERATKYVYDFPSRSWRQSSILVKLDPTPFNRGALRLVYHLLDLSDSHERREGEPANVSYVAKISMDPRDNENREIYFKDVEMQSLAKYYAALFNEYRPPKRVDFVMAWILKLEDRAGTPLCGVERYIEGSYRKWNNNFGFVSEDERNTPQAFSHFTYESSSHQMLVCDIQGVSDLYTDPQVHSIDKKSFGKGNLGQRGIDKFLQTHRCNAICRYLKLPPVNANYSDLGTLPMTQYMSYEQVKVVNIGNFPRQPVTGSGITTDPRLVNDTTHTETPILPNPDTTTCSPLLKHGGTSGSQHITHPRAQPELEEDQGCQGFCVLL